jgi:hypothetical protein
MTQPANHGPGAIYRLLDQIELVLWTCAYINHHLILEARAIFCSDDVVAGPDGARELSRSWYSS